MRPFLTASWRYLLMLNYEVDPDVLRPLVPSGTELDTWQGRTFASMVGFRFLDTRVRGLPVPFHRNFDEVNLRFYVRHFAEDGWRRGVVFVKEIVPRLAIATVARVLYNEPYVALPMRHVVAMEGAEAGAAGQLEYAWKANGRWQHLSATTRGAPRPSEPGSEEEFITEHYWGYTAQRDGGCAEYRVEHPRWSVWQVERSQLEVDVAGMYGERFVPFLRGKPSSAFVADGSAVAVFPGARLGPDTRTPPSPETSRAA
ncbi:YqjF family protein [Myxococcus sp. Y35]|uniref:YqjF family protein n=1 Tax=Pseudomyxococcus flavus TaxID=3115648 RepID=UPI003CF34853